MWYSEGVTWRPSVVHDSPGFDTGDEKLLREVLFLTEKKAKSAEVDDQLHAIWSVSLSQCTYWPLIVSSAAKGFALFRTMLSLYCHWKQRYLRPRGQEKVPTCIAAYFIFKLQLSSHSTCHLPLQTILSESVCRCKWELSSWDSALNHFPAYRYLNSIVRWLWFDRNNTLIKALECYSCSRHY